MAEINTNTTRVPKLRVSYADKVANDFEHTKRVMDHYISASIFVEEVINPSIRDVRILYAAYNNQLPDSYFRYVTNPLNSANADYTNWPARVRPYSIIRPNIDLLAGEYEKRPFSYTVKVHNADAVNALEDSQYQEVLNVLQQHFINALNQKGFQTGIDTQETPLPEKVKEKYVSNYRDQRAIMGEDALSIIIDDQLLIEKFKRLFQDWLIAGEVFTYKGVRSGKMVYERVSPLDMDYDKSPDLEYVEDGMWATRRMYMTPAQVYDLFYEELSEKEIDLIEDENGHISLRAIGTNTTHSIRDDQDLRRSKVVVHHVTWKYLMKVGVLTFKDEFGQDQQIEVPEQYKPDKEKGESVEWYWVNQVWEGYRIANGIYVGIQPLPNQRNTVNNMSECKLPYNGKRFSDTHAQNISPLEL